MKYKATITEVKPMVVHNTIELEGERGEDLVYKALKHWREMYSGSRDAIVTKIEINLEDKVPNRPFIIKKVLWQVFK